MSVRFDGQKSALFSAFVGATLLGAFGMAPPAGAGADAGTIGAGKVYTPNVSPYISFAKVTKCHSAGGANGAIAWQGRVTLGTIKASGVVLTWLDGPGLDSTVYVENRGTYSGTWRCVNLSR